MRSPRVTRKVLRGIELWYKLASADIEADLERFTEREKSDARAAGRWMMDAQVVIHARAARRKVKK